MEQFKTALRSLIQKICQELDIYEIPKRPVWTVVSEPGATPHVALDPERLDLSDILGRLGIGIFQYPEYKVVAEAAENSPELVDGVIVDGGGFLRRPEPNNITRMLVMNFLWRYLGEGIQLNWDETRFVKTFDELKEALRLKSVVSHSTIPLSNLKVDIDSLDFSDELKLQAASTDELEQWLNPDRNLFLPGVGPPQWNSQYVDKPAVLHARRTVIGQPPSTGTQEVPVNIPPADIDRVITALRLVMNAPISVIFQEQRSEGLIAFGGRSISWGPSPHVVSPAIVLDQTKATKVKAIWQLLEASPNIDLLRLPISRWASSLMRQSLEDRLIDVWIGLEALLLGGQEGELSYRSALLSAELLGTDGNHRKAIFDTMRISYRWRNAIVHALSTKRLSRKITLQDTVRDTTENLRLALLKALELSIRFNPKKLQSDLLGRDT